ncbi:hypothetical protein [Kribbella deserti]|uniref:Lipoprotein LpqN n=1 Tax=Kribbella deserti TaxID=1926257 RepID=A0ABV6QR51_9ACTN
MRFFFGKALPIFVAAVAVAVFGAYSGYVASELLPALPRAGSPNDPDQANSTPPQLGIIRKAPIPNDKPALNPKHLDYRPVDFKLRTKPNPSVEVALSVPRGWTFRAYPKEPQQIRYLDPTLERGLRIESGFTPLRRPNELMDSHIAELVSSQPPENDLQVKSRSSSTVIDDQGNARAVSTLVYTYVPSQTLRFVAVRWVALDGDKADVEMTVNGLPQDERALTAILDVASRTVTRSPLPN